MARRICGLTRADLERVLSESDWPSICQRLAVEKLISRRNGLIRPFALDRDGITEMPCNSGLTIAAGDSPVVSGRINGASATVRQLEKALHPEGLARVKGRLENR